MTVCQPRLSSTLFFNDSLANPDLHSFPTRRSSDLGLRPPADVQGGEHVGGAPVEDFGHFLPVVDWSTTNVFSDRKTTRLNSSHEWISYAVFCLKKKKKKKKKLTKENKYQW